MKINLGLVTERLLFSKILQKKFQSFKPLEQRNPNGNMSKGIPHFLHFYPLKKKSHWKCQKVTETE